MIRTAQYFTAVATSRVSIVRTSFPRSNGQISAHNRRITEFIQRRTTVTNSTKSSSEATATNVNSNNHVVAKEPLWQVASKSVLIGSVAGTLGSLAGMGGGFVMIPMMTSASTWLGLRLTQHQAHGTSLFAVAATGMAGAISYGSAVVQIPEAVAVSITAMITARWGAQTTLALSEISLRRALGILMLLMAPLVPAKAYYLQHIYTEKEQQPDATDTTTETQLPVSEWSIQKLMAPSIIGLGSGFLAGLFGVGGKNNTWLYAAFECHAYQVCFSITHSD